MTTLLTKSSDTASSVPSSLARGSGAELAVNTADQKLYVENSTGSVVDVTRGLHAYPVGSVFTSVSHSTVSQVQAALGGGNWEAIGEGKVLVGHSSSDSTFTAGNTGGNASFDLTADNLPEHKHNTNIRFEGDDKAVIDTTLEFDSGISGEELDHNADNNTLGNTTKTQSNLKADDSTNQTSDTTTISLYQPYLVVYMYKRIAD